MNQQEPLGELPKLRLLDEAGQPFDERIHAIFLPLEMRFRLKFNTIQEESILRNLFDRAGQLYFKEEQLGTRIERPDGLAWTILNNLGISELRRSEEKVINGSVAGPLAKSYCLRYPPASAHRSRSSTRSLLDKSTNSSANWNNDAQR